MTGARLAFSNIAVSFGDRVALHPASAALNAGELVVIVGPNGAGKSSLVRAMAGLIAHGGSVLIDGQDAAALDRGRRARALSYLPQGYHVHWPLAVQDIVALGRFPHGVSDPARMGETDRNAVTDAMARTDTLQLKDRRITELSGGERARVALARVLAVQAPIILADEPTAALDPHYQIDIMQRLKEEARAGHLVVAVTHDLGLAARLADRVLLLDGGKLVANGPPGEVLTPARLADVFGIEVFETQHEGAPVLVPWRLAGRP